MRSCSRAGRPAEEGAGGGPSARVGEGMFAPVTTAAELQGLEEEEHAVKSAPKRGGGRPEDSKRGGGLHWADEHGTGWLSRRSYQ